MNTLTILSDKVRLLGELLETVEGEIPPELQDAVDELLHEQEETRELLGLKQTKPNKTHII